MKVYGLESYDIWSGIVRGGERAPGAAAMKVGDRVIVRMKKSRKYGVLVKKRVTGWSVQMDGNAIATKDVREDRIEEMREHPAYNVNRRTA